MAGGLRLMSAALAVALAMCAQAEAKTFKVTTGADPAPSGCSKSNCSIREAVIAANEENGKDKIVLRSGRVHVFDLAGEDEDEGVTGDLDVLSPLTLKASGAKPATIDAGGLDRVLHIQAPTSISRIEITGGSFALVNQSGVGIYSPADPVDITRSRVTANVSTANNTGAGGFYLGGGGSISKSVVSNNSVTANGGGGVAVGLPGRPILVEDTVVRGNDAIVAAGLFSSRATISGSVFKGNDALGCGGLDINLTELRDSLVKRNTATSSFAGFGGGVCVGQSTSITDSTIKGNFAETGGGGVHGFGSEGPIVDTTISGNTTNGDGGGVDVIFANAFEIRRSTLSGNIAGGDGGGLRAGSASVTVQNSTITGNEGVLGGGIVANEQPTGPDPSRVSLRFSTIAGNLSGSGGGIASVDPASYDSEGTIITQNTGSAPDCAAVVTSNGHNLIGDVTGCNSFSASTDIPGVNPHLMAFGDYGGPTLTIKPESDSPAVDNGGTGCPEVDQRGKKRPKGEDCDIGAVEAK